MHVAVVGAGGFIGGSLCRALPAAGHTVCAVSSASDGFDAATGLLRDQPLSQRPLDAMIYLSQSPHYRLVPEHAPHLWSVNVVSAIKAAEWAVRCGARRIVHASTGNVYLPSFDAHRESDEVNRRDWYPLSKRQAEEALQLFDGIDVTSARLFGVYGPGQRSKLVPNLAAKLLADEEILLAPHPDRGDDGGLHLNMVYVDDVTRVLIRLLETRGPAAINVAAPEVSSIRSMSESMGRCLGRRPRFRAAPAARQFDLIADVTLLTALVGSGFTSFDAGAALTLREYSATGS